MNRFSMLALASIIGMGGTGACGEAEVDEVPETAEIELEEGRLEFEEETVLGPDDIGEDLMATGWVVGLPLPNGFFLRTEDDRVIFVETDESVQPGETVRVMGPLTATEAVVFEGWEADAFDTGFEAEWDVETVLYIDAISVSPTDAPVPQDGTEPAGTIENGDRPVESGAEADDAGTAGTPGAEESRTDPGSKSDG